MNKRARIEETKPGAGSAASSLPAAWGGHDHSVLVLQGGGALGAYQAGVYEGLLEASVPTDWVAGVSIGGINAALIAGNPPERRLARLQEFWERVSERSVPTLPAALDILRPFLNRMSTASAFTVGVPGFFVPRMLPPFMAPDGKVEALSFYDTEPLRKTLEELVDFDYVNGKHVRLSLGAVNVRNGNSVYFDNSKTRIGPEHVLASGALPPGFPPVLIDGEMYWDGGIVSNSPLSYVTEEDYRMSALIFQVDVFSGLGELPQNLQQVQERVKDIQYSSKTRFNTDRLRQFETTRAALSRVLEMLPAEHHSNPDVQRLVAASKRGPVSLVHLINRHPTRSFQYKDCEFSRATVHDLWKAGLDDVRRVISHPQWRNVTELGNGMRVYDLIR